MLLHLFEIHVDPSRRTNDGIVDPCCGVWLQHPITGVGGWRCADIDNDKGDRLEEVVESVAKRG